MVVDKSGKTIKKLDPSHKIQDFFPQKRYGLLISSREEDDIRHYTINDDQAGGASREIKVEMPQFLYNKTDYKLITWDTHIVGMDDERNLYFYSGIVFYDNRQQANKNVGYILRYDQQGALVGKVNRSNFFSYPFVMNNGDIYIAEYDMHSEKGPQILKWILRK
ncbi:MAG: hypothetical protein MUF78_08840 [Candidatus Edwardsbacteria bacterium]|nr:hypothetical protein [Candidatus Edwardsbacteria bacterium]